MTIMTDGLYDIAITAVTRTTWAPTSWDSSIFSVLFNFSSNQKFDFIIIYNATHCNIKLINKEKNSDFGKNKIKLQFSFDYHEIKKNIYENRFFQLLIKKIARSRSEFQLVSADSGPYLFVLPSKYTNSFRVTFGASTYIYYVHIRTKFAQV